MNPSHFVEHGGPDDGSPITWDFSTNANPLPPPPGLLDAVAQADRRRYPDPRYTALRACLSTHWRADAARVLPTAGSSEAIRRLSLAACLHGVREVWVPEPGYGDYRAAAQALGLQVHAYGDGHALLTALAASERPTLVWLCEPCNPTGHSLPPSFWIGLSDTLAGRAGLLVALDRAYEPLRLQGEDPVPAHLARQCWQLWSPNKALGLTGVRAGALLAPEPAGAPWLAALHELAPSWVLSAEGVALWHAWCDMATQDWLARSRATLLAWRDEQQSLLASMGWQIQPSITPFFVARPPGTAMRDAALRHAWLQTLRTEGLKLRDATSLGLPGWLRLSTQGPQARQALQRALVHSAGQWRDAA
ncbi:aminotransferase class I/II-fold pyridoxal phosphate-dependent enzyme [Aquabacterium soli]|uniref:histidinol-phosphate transaminase n=1 Tax=Aquabacterium soli TaxID=2493092 RepID=A0A426VEB2_9BURK|nr:aminotransferase class I/II-fold pyridoxal phosphate-dependent enzyme [Aquabacterium soli]RRS05185.1 aminotransferase class I/II-fold pyridoxal phosphate-dependent enzyme [Aquabacterium soli]